MNYPSQRLLAQFHKCALSRLTTHPSFKIGFSVVVTVKLAALFRSLLKFSGFLHAAG
jgi:hypothetical protein